jgi:hypothetical protein
MFHKAMNLMKNSSTSKLPIKVRRVPLKDLDGCCEKRKSYFLVKINKDLQENHSIDVLIHEIAHVDSWTNNEDDIHGERWGIAYSRLYRIWEKYIEEYNNSLN